MSEISGRVGRQSDQEALVIRAVRRISRLSGHFFEVPPVERDSIEHPRKVSIQSLCLRLFGSSLCFFHSIQQQVALEDAPTEKTVLWSKPKRLQDVYQTCFRVPEGILQRSKHLLKPGTAGIHSHPKFIRLLRHEEVSSYIPTIFLFDDKPFVFAYSRA